MSQAHSQASSSYRSFISHSGGDRNTFAGIGWYRKHFKLPASAKAGKVFLEFEGLKQAGRFFVNGQPAGKFENGVTACGLDITSLVRFGDADNVLAVKVDNSNNYVEEATRVGYQWMGRAFNPNFGGLNHNVWLTGYASIYWSDSNADGRQQSSTVLRVSGKVDGVRLPKEAFHVYRVMQNSQPDLHLIGHWTYPAATKKTMYVVAQGCDAVELFVNGKSLGTNTTPTNGYLYVFPDVVFASGAIKAVATQGGKVVAQQEIKTAGEPKALKLTVHAGPAGLQADGSDVAFMDFEVMDAQGNRCPTDEARVDFAVQGPAIWRGGLNSTKPNSTNNRFLNTECGINRVAIRSTLTPGTITLTAAREGLTPAIVNIESKPVEIIGGLLRALPPTLPSPRGAAQ